MIVQLNVNREEIEVSKKLKSWILFRKENVSNRRSSQVLCGTKFECEEFERTSISITGIIGTTHQMKPARG
jgi:hypothetical protein